ncbi:hypothetical protein [Dactylosporangium sp. CA-233914]|uniref:hypothetical protein n=1 Tax=Dactylosporangium sp. CA-233914 TaxID=3239934 RepID=UPI003D8BBA75
MRQSGRGDGPAGGRRTAALALAAVEPGAAPILADALRLGGWEITLAARCPAAAVAATAAVAAAATTAATAAVTPAVGTTTAAVAEERLWVVV